ncbi:QRICH2 [Branchiostoma lanceolatum]|uniref:QRICH2 protein n=1 Tax=Branchiostoma lanceolatum TaxID=7740 RepID=A0A8J9YV79_BRALA|nr:QRICH2 [Branchiostoma lanceolatum]
MLTSGQVRTLETTDDGDQAQKSHWHPWVFGMHTSGAQSKETQTSGAQPKETQMSEHGSFYRRPLANTCPPRCSLQVVAVNNLKTYMKTMCASASAGIPMEGRNITNHSGKATCATQIFAAGFDEQTIMARTGHISSAVRAYKRPSDALLKDVSNTLQPPKKPSPTKNKVKILETTAATATTTTAAPPNTATVTSPAAKTPTSNLALQHRNFNQLALQQQDFKQPALQQQDFKQPAPQQQDFKQPALQQQDFKQPAPQQQDFKQPALQQQDFKQPALQQQDFKQPALQQQDFKQPALQQQDFKQPALQQQDFKQPALQQQDFKQPALQQQDFKQPARQQQDALQYHYMVGGQGSAVRGPLLKIVGQAIAVSVAKRAAMFPLLSPPVFAYVIQDEPDQETWPADTLLPYFLPDSSVRAVIEMEALESMLAEEKVTTIDGQEVDLEPASLLKESLPRPPGLGPDGPDQINRDLEAVGHTIPTAWVTAWNRLTWRNLTNTNDNIMSTMKKRGLTVSKEMANSFHDYLLSELTSLAYQPIDLTLIKAPRYLVFAGPSGTGETSTAKAFAANLEAVLQAAEPTRPKPAQQDDQNDTEAYIDTNETILETTPQPQQPGSQIQQHHQQQPTPVTHYRRIAPKPTPLPVPISHISPYPTFVPSLISPPATISPGLIPLLPNGPIFSPITNQGGVIMRPFGGIHAFHPYNLGISPTIPMWFYARFEEDQKGSLVERKEIKQPEKLTYNTLKKGLEVQVLEAGKLYAGNLVFWLQPGERDRTLLSAQIAEFEKEKDLEMKFRASNITVNQRVGESWPYQKFDMQYSTDLVDDIVRSANPKGRFWIKVDGTDIKPALQESKKGDWNGDPDLQDSKLEQLREEYDKRVKLCNDLEKERGRDSLQERIQELITHFEADTQFLLKSLQTTVNIYQKKIVPTTTSEEKLKERSWEIVELSQLIEQSKQFAQSYEEILSLINPESPIMDTAIL